MNKYDVRYDIRLARKDDIEGIMKFIDTYWKKNHIMAVDRKLFEYEYVNEDNVNFILAIDKKTKTIEGIFGFLNCSNTTDSEKKDVWGSMWKVNDSKYNIPFLGIELAKRFKDLVVCRMHIGNGANPKTTIPLRRMFFKDKVVKMKQYYLLNENIKDYKIGVINDASLKSDVEKEMDVKFIKFNTIKDLVEKFNIENLNLLPYKDNWYLSKRYYNHPYYDYYVYGIEKEEKVKALIVMREIEACGKKVLRIVDYIGDRECFKNSNKFFEDLFKAKEYEYVDFYQYGFEDEYLKSAGFVFRDEKDKNIIPNYFEPFLQENADIWAHYKFDGTTFFKADGDQDRPNIVRN